MFTIKLPTDDVDIDNVKWIGWEPNEQGKYLPRCASLAASMDPQRYKSKYYEMDNHMILCCDFDIFQQVGRNWCLLKSQTYEMATFAEP